MIKKKHFSEGKILECVREEIPFHLSPPRIAFIATTIQQLGIDCSRAESQKYCVLEERYLVTNQFLFQSLNDRMATMNLHTVV